MHARHIDDLQPQLLALKILPSNYAVGLGLSHEHSGL